MPEASETLAKIAPFMLRARAVVAGRERLVQMRRRLAFVLFTTDLSENSRAKLAERFPCPLVQALTCEDVERLFQFRHTKVLGFRRCDLSRQALKLLRALAAETPPPPTPNAPPNTRARSGSEMQSDGGNEDHEHAD